MCESHPHCVRHGYAGTFDVPADYVVRKDAKAVVAASSGVVLTDHHWPDSPGLLDWPLLNAELVAIHIQIARELGFSLNTLPPTLEPAQVAVVLGVSEGTLEQWRSAATVLSRPDRPALPFQKMGRSLRYPVWHLARFMLANTFVRSGEPLFPSTGSDAAVSADSSEDALGVVS